MTLSAYEESALVKIQSAARGKVAREELKRLEADEKEEREWRIALSKRRERIERLERELQHVEEMPAAAVDTYSQTARYGRNNKDAAARAIQGIFRFVVRVKSRKLAKAKARESAARTLQKFARNVAKRAEEKTRGVESPSKLRDKATKEMSRRAADDMSSELPSVQRVAELQAMVSMRLEDRKRGRGYGKTAESELRDMAERAKAAMTAYHEGVTDARLAMISRVEAREDAASLASSIWACHDLKTLMDDSRLATSASGGNMTAVPHALKEYNNLLMQVAKKEHAQLLRALQAC